MKDWKDAFTPEQLEIRRNRAKEWNRINKERVKANQAKRTPEQIAASAKRAYLKKKAADPEYHNRIQGEYHKRNPWANHFYIARYRCNPKAKNAGYRKYYSGRGIEFRLTMAEVKHLWERDGASLMKRPSIDRIMIRGHYELSNCRFMELSDNSSRQFNPDWVDIKRERHQAMKARQQAIIASFRLPQPPAPIPPP